MDFVPLKCSQALCFLYSSNHFAVTKQLHFPAEASSFLHRHELYQSFYVTLGEEVNKRHFAKCKTVASKNLTNQINLILKVIFFSFAAR